jgi:hypothetical protein
MLRILRFPGATMQVMRRWQRIVMDTAVGDAPRLVMRTARRELGRPLTHRLADIELLTQ